MNDNIISFDEHQDIINGCEQAIKELKKQIRGLKRKIKGLQEYETAFHYLVDYWDSFEKEQQREINKELNKVFVLNKGEQIDD